MAWMCGRQLKGGQLAFPAFPAVCVCVCVVVAMLEEASLGPLSTANKQPFRQCKRTCLGFRAPASSGGRTDSPARCRFSEEWQAMLSVYCHGLDWAKGGGGQHNPAALDDATQTAVVKLVMRKLATKPRPRSEVQANIVRLWSGPFATAHYA